MKLSVKQTLGLAIVSCLTLAGSTVASARGNGANGNSSFGLNQRTDLQTGSGNSAFGQRTSANARMKSDNDGDEQDENDVAKTPKTKKAKHTWSSYPGNSAFGRNQRINHLKGSGNNIHGKTVSASAKSKNGKNH